MLQFELIPQVAVGIVPEIDVYLCSYVPLIKRVEVAPVMVTVEAPAAANTPVEETVVTEFANEILCAAPLNSNLPAIKFVEDEKVIV
jgi:hypothetical protein